MTPGEDDLALLDEAPVNQEPSEQSPIQPKEIDEVIPQWKTEAILRIKDTLCLPERYVRERFVRKLKKLEYYWNSVQYIYWDAIAKDYRDYQDPSQIQEDPEVDTDPQSYAKVVNIYRAHGEAWIAAIAAGIPFTRFYPDDADNPNDVSTAKAFSRIAELIQRHNQAEILFLRSLYLLFNAGVVFCYNETRTSKDYGTFKSPIEGEESVTNREHFCPSCGAPLGQEEVVDPMSATPMPPMTCPNCGVDIQPEFQDKTETFPAIVGYSDEPKSREILRCYGPLHVEVPHYISRLDETPYLRLVTEEPVGLIQEIYPEFAHLIKPSGDVAESDRWARQNRQYSGDENENLCTVARTWFRPWAYNYHGDPQTDEVITELKKEYPDGLYSVIINENLVVECVADKLDDHWTATVSPFSEHIHAEPQGTPLIPVQDITNELINLTLETIEFGIPETFADPSVLDFDAYRKSEAKPGMVYPAKAMSGQSLGNGFHEIKAASLSQEVDRFADRLDSAGQFVIGTFPTIYGGALEGGSGTAREYELSRAQALQRLSGTWTVLKSWWAQVMAKSVRAFATNMNQDEKFVKSQGNSYVNVWIRKADLQGKVGEIEPETSEAFPISWAQKRDVLLQLIQMQDPQIGEILIHPENASFVAELIGLPDLYIPGDDDRNKQLIEIGMMLQAQPSLLGIDPMTGQEQFQSSVPVDQDIDKHEIEAEVCLAWLKSEVGMDAKETNPAGWMNIRAHYMEHNSIVQMMMQQQAMMEQQAAASGEENAEPGA